MSCIRGQRDDQDSIADLERIIKRFAWEAVDSSKLPLTERLSRQKKVLSLEINWNLIDIQHQVTRFVIRRPQGGPEASRTNICLFKTDFTNDSKSPQQYTFKTERQTRSVCELSVQKGFSIGGDLELSFKLPVVPVPGKIDPLEVTGGMTGQFNWTKTQGETKEEVMTWSVDSQVVVEPGHSTSAALMVLEEDVTARVTIKTTFKSRLDNHKFRVGIRRKKDNKLLQFTQVTRDQIVEARKSAFKADAEDDGTFTCTTEGVCKVAHAVKQFIEIKSVPFKHQPATVEGPVITENDSE